MDLFFGTSNPGKLRELRRLVAGLPVRIVSPGDLGRAMPDVVEDGATFAENAAKKASELARFAGLHALADDSGLCVDALGGAPGVFSARWSDGDPVPSPAEPARDLSPAAAGLARDERNNDKLLASLAAVPDDRRGAEYQAVLAVARPDGSIAGTVTGVCRGRIGHVRRGTGGFGYDPLFLPEAEAARGGGRTMAELSAEEKDAISHRGDAFRRIRPLLERLAHDLDGNAPKR